MTESSKAVWFEGTTKISCNINDVEKSLNNLGEHFKEISSIMPGMTSVKLIEQGSDFVTIETNEGIMKRTNISIVSNKDKIIVEFDEEYQAGKTITTNSHFVKEFEEKNNEIRLRVEISNLKAPGFMGFFYRNFGSKNIGSSFLSAYENYLGKQSS
ncbi:MAG: hypothetical protein HOF35_12560 [Bacteroidetes bacterium]|jgi:hypothetical protein|nr:hypothetical protein [Bacteroidota bacterium]MBT3935084.1 hypothetical protein [Bacteroidota bacterium]MBT5527952.1 hypothetical protein [Cytophagia bacterium]